MASPCLSHCPSRTPSAAGGGGEPQRPHGFLLTLGLLANSRGSLVTPRCSPRAPGFSGRLPVCVAGGLFCTSVGPSLGSSGCPGRGTPACAHRNWASRCPQDPSLWGVKWPVYDSGVPCCMKPRAGHLPWPQISMGRCWGAADGEGGAASPEGGSPMGQGGS